MMPLGIGASAAVVTPIATPVTRTSDFAMLATCAVIMSPAAAMKHRLASTHQYCQVLSSSLGPNSPSASRGPERLAAGSAIAAGSQPAGSQPGSG
jgi:hypothetical protein